MEPVACSPFSLNCMWMSLEDTTTFFYKCLKFFVVRPGAKAQSDAKGNYQKFSFFSMSEQEKRHDKHPSIT